MLAAICATSGASAGTLGQASPPPLVLSPNLTEPWILQLQPSGRLRERRPTVQRRMRDDARPYRTARTQNPAKVAPRQIDPRFLPTIVEYTGKHKPGTIIVDTVERYLYLVQRDGTARRYGVGVGKPGFEWAGTHKVTRKAEWPDWRPPAEMRKRRPDLPAHMAGGPQNPLGARALYLGSTLYRIHGSNQPWTIGHAVSSGCIRMRNEDVTDLYERVGVGTRVHVI
ncbi:MAG: L,D-transpeptidase [Rhodobacteraceae bacterium]|nr:L,D-transpeptidase [Paracoccaceae bacterium]